jgi:hypothetical protein
MMRSRGGGVCAVPLLAYSYGVSAGLITAFVAKKTWVAPNPDGAHAFFVYMLLYMYDRVIADRSGQCKKDLQYGHTKTLYYVRRYDPYCTRPGKLGRVYADGCEAPPRAKRALRKF